MISQLTFLLSNNLSDKSQFNLDIMTEPQLTGGLEGVEGPNSIGGNKSNQIFSEKKNLFDLIRDTQNIWKLSNLLIGELAQTNIGRTIL